MKRLPAREARYADDVPLGDDLRAALERLGITRLFTHQGASLRAVRSGANVVVVTGTASGKTLCYNLPVLESLSRDESARALYLFPTKALTQDQAAALNRLLDPSGPLAGRATVGIYDGDTPSHQRSRIRSKATVILSNPDMLHTGILPYHPKWAQFFAGLKFVILDEIHTYRGIFGSHVANVIRRLKRVAGHYGAHPQFICSSATIANPGPLAEAVAGEKFEVIGDDGSPQGEKFFLLWNPPVVDVYNFLRRSANVEASELLAELMKAGCSTILFARARVVSELIHRYTQERLRGDKKHKSLADKIAPYRGGYLPEDRRRIERELFSGRLLAVSSTNALELGIDVGSLDAAILVGFPGTIASTWQQAGRAGRRGAPSLAVLVAYDEPIDQYIAHRPEYLFEKPVEEAVVDAANPYVLQGHLLCAAAERPLDESDASFFGDNTLPVADALARAGRLKSIGGKYYLSTPGSPAAKLNLRLISSDTYEIVDTSSHQHRVIGNVDSISAPELVYPGAVYLHEGASYLCDKLDADAKIAYVRAADVDYYTQPVLESTVTVTAASERRDFASFVSTLGDIDVTWATTAFKKIKFFTMEVIGQGELDLPAQTLATRALWITPAPALLESIKDLGLSASSGITGAKNLLMTALSMLAMSDLRDIWAIVNTSQAPPVSVFLYDRYPGGIGYAEKGFDRVQELLKRALDIVKGCPCGRGCPSCVGLPNVRPPQHQDPELYGGGYIPDKMATQVLLETLLSQASFTSEPQAL
jgi:DEAD/DEAH box helicase domain-containing protein